MSFKLLNDQISAQLEGRTDIELQFNPEMKEWADENGNACCEYDNGKRTLNLYENEGKYFVKYVIAKELTEAEYNEVIEKCEQDIFGNLSIKIEKNAGDAYKNILKSQDILGCLFSR